MDTFLFSVPAEIISPGDWKIITNRYICEKLKKPREMIWARTGKNIRGALPGEMISIRVEFRVARALTGASWNHFAIALTGASWNHIAKSQRRSSFIN